MSSEAIAWAFRQDIKPSALKFTLVAMCECANYKSGRITPSIAHLCEITGQDRKTVISNIAELEKRSLIADTGERTGHTKQIKVYNATIGTVPETEQYQERNRSVPPVKQSQKRDTEPSSEPSLPSETTSPTVVRPRKASMKVAASIPDWMPIRAWAGYLEMRKSIGKAPTPRAIELMIAKLDRWRADGHDPGTILDTATEHNWTGLYEPKETQNANNRNSAGSGNVRAFGKPKDGAIAALDRRLGLDGSPGPDPSYDAGPGEADRVLATTGPRRLFS